MVLPLAECPAAPAQGALAIECRADDAATRDLLAGLHCESSARAVARERQVLADWGGGCHQNLGATAVAVDGLGALMYVRGQQSDRGNVVELRWQPDGPAPAEPCWDGTIWRAAAYRTRHYRDLPLPHWLESAGATFVAHSRAVPDQWYRGLATGAQRIWTSGVRSWLRLAARGVWVEGCAEELGFDLLRPLLGQGVLQLPPLANWQVLTHADGTEGWPCNRVIATYVAEATEELNDQHPAVIALRAARSIFWTSGSQYSAFRQWVPADAMHACRYGKTYNQLRENLPTGTLTVYPSVAQWRARARTQQ
jgi:hydroxymethylbilane synthase